MYSEYTELQMYGVWVDCSNLGEKRHIDVAERQRGKSAAHGAYFRPVKAGRLTVANGELGRISYHYILDLRVLSTRY